MLELIIPTRNPEQARQMARTAQARAGCAVRVRIVHDEHGEGFTKTVNRGLRQVDGEAEAVCLLNDDAVPVTDEWLRILHQQLLKYKDVGFAGPSGPCRTMPQAMGEAGGSWAQLPPIHVGHLAGFCLLVRHEVIDKVGLLDERFIHYGSDVEWQWRSGFNSLWVPAVYCEHEVGKPIAKWWEHDKGLLEAVKRRHDH